MKHGETREGSRQGQQKLRKLSYAWMSPLVGLSLDEALRAWLAGDSLPAHPATAEATLFAFAQAYHRANPEVIASIDTLEALCLLMAALSSTLASGTHVQPLERRQFVAHCRLVGLEGAELVEQLFSGITARPIPCAAASSVSRHVRHIFSVPTQHEGWLRFEEATAGEGAPVADRPADKTREEGGGDGHRWRLRYAVLNDLGLFIFRTAPVLGIDAEWMATVPLQHLVVTQPPPSRAVDSESPSEIQSGSLSFQLRGHLLVEARSLELDAGSEENGLRVVLLVKAQTLADKEAWLEALLATVTAAPLRSNFRAALAQAAGEEEAGRTVPSRGMPAMRPSSPTSEGRPKRMKARALTRAVGMAEGSPSTHRLHNVAAVSSATATPQAMPPTALPRRAAPKDGRRAACGNGVALSVLLGRGRTPVEAVGGPGLGSAANIGQSSAGLPSAATAAGLRCPFVNRTRLAPWSEMSTFAQEVRGREGDGAHTKNKNDGGAASPEVLWDTPKAAEAEERLSTVEAACLQHDTWCLFNAAVSASVAPWFYDRVQVFITRLLASRMAWVLRQQARRIQQRTWRAWWERVRAVQQLRLVARWIARRRGPRIGDRGLRRRVLEGWSVCVWRRRAALLRDRAGGMLDPCVSLRRRLLTSPEVADGGGDGESGEEENSSEYEL